MGGIAAILLFAYFVWPTPWAAGMMAGYSVRTSRFTGCLQILTVRGWVGRGNQPQCATRVQREESEARRQAAASARAVDTAAGLAEYRAGKPQIMAALILNAELTLDQTQNRATVRIENTTSCALSSLRIKIGGHEYSNDPPDFDGPFGPGSSDRFEFILAGTEQLQENTGWQMVDVEYQSPVLVSDSVIEYRANDPACLNP